MIKTFIKGASENVYYEKLANGLEIFMVPNNKTKNFYLTLNVKFGSINTDFKYQNKEYHIPKGVAHYLEHLMFNMLDGSAFDYYSKLGSSVNAFTSFDETCYEVFANSNFKENLEYLIKYVYTPYFTKELVNNERGIITEEIKMYEDSPDTELLYGLYRNIYVNDEHQYLISGTVDDVKKIKLEDIENAYNAFYQPANMFLVITGDFLPEEAVAIVSKQMSAMSFKKYEKPLLILPNEPYKVKNEYSEKEMNVDKYKVTIGLKIPKSNFKSLKLSDLDLVLYLNLIMKANYGGTSLFKEELQNNNIINDGLSFIFQNTPDYFVKVIIASTDYPDYFIDKVMNKQENLEITEEDLIRKKKNSISSLIMIYDDIEAVNSEIQDDIIDYNKFIANIYDEYNKLNIEEAIKVKNHLNKYIKCVSVLKPKKEI